MAYNKPLDVPLPVALWSHDDDNDDNYDAVHGSVFSKKQTLFKYLAVLIILHL